MTNSFLEYLEEYNRQVKPVVRKVFAEQIRKVSSISPIATTQLKEYEEYLEGGKKLRGALLSLGFKMFGGKSGEDILRASLVMEIVHAGLLMHDDFMDGDSLRRGKETIHQKYSRVFGKHFGDSMAINMGDGAFFIAFKLLNNLNFSKELLSGATEHLSGLLTEVVLGQVLDITFEKEKRFREKEALLIHRYKTADYTISGPLSLGAILAGVGEKELEAVKEYGILVGIAFQIRDDELGMFSTQEELGKGIGADIKEGKVTLLSSKVLELSKGKDKEFLKKSFGNRNLSNEEIEKVRGYVLKYGALSFSQNLAKKMVEESKEKISSIKTDQHYRKMLSELADWVIERKN